MDFDKKPIFCLVGASGSGKTTLINRATADKDLSIHQLVTTTTRGQRPNEENGTAYWFVSHEQFMKGVQNGDFFEYEETHGNLYGTSKLALSESLNRDGYPILSLDIRGAKSLKRYFPEQMVMIFVTTSSGAELRHRIEKRGVKPEDLEVRLATAKREYAHLLSEIELVDYLLINSDFEECYAKMKAIVNAELIRGSRKVRDISCISESMLKEFK